MAEHNVEHNSQENSDQAETIEFIEMLKTMTDKERQQIKGIMIGIQLSNQYHPKRIA